MFEFTVFTLNQTNITSQSEVVAFINTIREIVGMGTETRYLIGLGAKL